MFSLDNSNGTTGGKSLSKIVISDPEISPILAFVGVP